jgi:zinc/manganese transport system substrate-binding protein
MILRGRTAGLSVTVAASLLTACGGNGSGADTPETNSPALLATTSIWADITSQVACGAPVAAIIPAGADPHGFEPSLQDRQRIESAGTVIANGNQLEESLTDLLATAAADSGVNVVEITPHVDLIEPADKGELTEDEHTEDEHTEDEHTEDEHTGEAAEVGDDGHGHGEGGDPHIWQDPTRVAGALDVIASAVIASGFNADEVQACTDAYRAELEALDAELTSLLAGIPAEQRVLVTNHDAFAYFADRYEFEIVGTVIPSTSTLGDSSAGQLAELADVIERYAVPAIFTEELASAADAEALADRLDVAVVPLTSDSLAAEGPAATYIGMLRANAEAIATALT